MKTKVNVENGFEVEKIRRPYGATPRKEKKFKKEKRINRETVRYDS